MSWEATAWAKRTRGHRSHGEARLLLVLADYAQPNTHEAWPSQQALADDCEMTDRNVRYCLDSLTKRGFLSVVRKGNQYQPTLYQLAVAQESEPEIQRTGDVSELPPPSGAVTCPLCGAGPGKACRKAPSTTEAEHFEMRSQLADRSRAAWWM